MAEAILLGGAVSAFMQALVADVDSVLKEEWRLLRGVKKEVKGLKKIMVMVQALLEDAEERQLKEKMVRTWLEKLKEVAYDVEDILDQFATESLQLEVEGGGNRARTSMVKKIRNRCLSLFPKLYSHSKAMSVMEVKEKLYEVLKLGNMIDLRPMDVIRQSEIPSWRLTSSLPEENVVGRDEARDQIIEMLSFDAEPSPFHDKNLSVIAIVGIGGVGKTTLAQHVYNDARLKDRFDLMIWVCVSNDFNVERLTRMIIESVTKVTPKQISFNNLQLHLKDILEAKRFLIVLDDVWNTDATKWEDLRKPLKYGGEGSRILITARSHEVAHAMNVTTRYPLGGLADDVYRSFFERCAFGNEKVANMHPRLREIGWEIAMNLGGSPLAAKTLGRLLNTSLTVMHWVRIKGSDIWELPQNENDILPALRLSYLNLPAPLKRCFAYCSMFPKDHRFDRNVLVQMWMAQDFIRDAAMEDVGNRYFNDLLHRCFFQYAGIVRDSEWYTMHDLIHELAQSVSLNECFAVREDQQFQASPGKVRHISSHSVETVVHDGSGFKKLRSFVFVSKNLYRCIKVPDDLFLHFNCLRVLDLSDSGLKEFPELLGSLVHLRYLDLSHNPLESLPESLGRLYNLQTLKLEECSRLRKLPSGTRNLVNLRLLVEPSYTDDDSFLRIAGIGRLVCLQGLKGFRVSKEEGYKIGELKELTELRGSMCIRNLKDVGGGTEAASAGLSRKSHLDDLSLVWPERVGEPRLVVSPERVAVDEEVLEGLEPHPNLRGLSIIRYGGIKSPSWMETCVCSSLQTLTLFGCGMWEVLPPLGQLQFLRELYIIGLAGVRKVGRQFFGGGFPSLETLKLDGMDELEEWGSDIDIDGQWFPRLSTVRITDCPKLREMPPLHSLPCLKLMDLSNCQRIEALREKDLPVSLEKIFLFGCTNLRLLPVSLCVLVSLERFDVSHCPKIESMPRLPPLLQQLHISECRKLHERCRKGRGADWPNIAHVPNISGLLDG